MALSDLKLKALLKNPQPGKYSDGGGLYLRVDDKGRGRWQWKIRVAGKETSVSYGAYPDTSLAQARELHAAAKLLQKQGINPNEAKREAKVSKIADATNSFETVARAWFENWRVTVSPGYADRVIRRLEADVFPWLGTEPIGAITPQKVLATLRRIESRGVFETTHRVHESIQQVFRFAVAENRVEINPASELKGALKKAEVKRHFPAITDPLRMGELLRACDDYRGTHVVRAALRLLPLVFVRPGELRCAAWPEFDLDKAIWTIPAARMKRRKAGKLFGDPHIVPLSTQAVEILRELQPLTGKSDYVFRGERHHDRPMSDMAIVAALRGMGFANDEMVAHGFRASARTMLAERLDIDETVIEAQLAHTVKDTLGRAYNRTQFLDKRKAMMQTWADYLDRLRKGADVLQLPVRAA